MGRPCKCCGKEDCPCSLYSIVSSLGTYQDPDDFFSFVSSDGEFEDAPSSFISRSQSSSNYKFVSSFSFCEGVNVQWEFDESSSSTNGDLYKFYIGTSDGTDGAIFTFVYNESGVCGPINGPDDGFRVTVEIDGVVEYDDVIPALEFRREICYFDNTVKFNDYHFENVSLPGKKISFESSVEREFVEYDVREVKNYNPAASSGCEDCVHCWERSWTTGNSCVSATADTILSQEANPWFGRSNPAPWASTGGFTLNNQLDLLNLSNTYTDEGYLRLYLNSNAVGDGAFIGFEIKQLSESHGSCTHGLYSQYGTDGTVQSETLRLTGYKSTNPLGEDIFLFAAIPETGDPIAFEGVLGTCLLYTSPSPRD